jgi:hypothetical protein
VESKKIAIIVFTYARLDHTKTTLESLASNKRFNEHPIIVYSDGPKTGHEEKVLSVRTFLKDFRENNTNVKVIERTKNIGLEKSIISGITETLEKYPAVIVIEDDIRTSPAFLNFMDTMLSKYKDEKRIGSISGYTHSRDIMKVPESYKYDIFFVPRTSSWGWATWKDRWEDVDWDVCDIETFIKDKETQKDFNKGGKDLSGMLIKQVRRGIDTWDIQWSYHNFKKNRLTIYPTISYVENIGHDGTGIHCGISSSFINAELNMKTNLSLPKDVALDKHLVNQYKRVFEMTIPKFFGLAFNKIVFELKKFLQFS